MSKNEITVFLFFLPADRFYECTVPASCSFHQILETMKPMIADHLQGYLSMNQKLYVFSCHDNCECDLDVSLRSLKAENGMEFYVI